MSQFNEPIEALEEAGRARRYQQLAEAALRFYDLGDVTPHFIQHNGGVSYRLDGTDGHPLYLLKIAEAAGESGGIPPDRMELAMQWLKALSAGGEIVVQEPIASRDGSLVAEVPFSDLDDPFRVTAQRWLEGEHIHDAFTLEQSHRCGAMMATLHERSSRWAARSVRVVEEYDQAWLANSLATLSRAVTASILAAEERRTVEAGVARVAEIMGTLGMEPDVWGPIHRDLHHENLLFHGEHVYPIDFDDFVIGQFAYDLGVIFYHVMYLEVVAMRRAIRDGYRSVRAVPDVPLWAESFLCAAALGNLAFQATLARERASEHFARNAREFATVFCAKLAKGTPFVLDDCVDAS
jgi:Ser/Thr protein kinase RdoA (MazF antagonist)